MGDQHLLFRVSAPLLRPGQSRIMRPSQAFPRRERAIRSRDLSEEVDRSGPSARELDMAQSRRRGLGRHRGPRCPAAAAVQGRRLLTGPRCRRKSAAARAIENATAGRRRARTGLRNQLFLRQAPINLALTDPSTNPNDTITVTVSGVPSDWNLSAGTNNGDGSWTVQTSDPPALTVT